MSETPSTVRRGSEGEAVKGAQNALRARGFLFEHIDGVFSFETERAARDFQHASGLEVDGIVGANTWRALVVHLVRPGDTLSRIAERELGDKRRWPEIHELNRELVPDPDVIEPGQVLALPVAVHAG